MSLPPNSPAQAFRSSVAVIFERENPDLALAIYDGIAGGCSPQEALEMANTDGQRQREQIICYLCEIDPDYRRELDAAGEGEA